MGCQRSPVRYILHADLDAFYASVEQVDRPELRGKPVLVGASPEERGVVAACSYEARKYGVHSAMPMIQALRMCPQAIRVPPRFGRYRQVSEKVMAILRSITPLVEPLSLDEAYLDVTEVVASGVSLADMARSLKERVRKEVGLVVSIGVGTSKSLAKIASDIKKPDGLVVVEPGQEREFLAPLPVRRLPGVGPSTEGVLVGKGITTVGQLASQTEAWARELLGKRGPELLAMSRGEDHRPVVTERAAKSISAETTFVQDVDDQPELDEQLKKLCQQVARRLNRSQVKGRTVTVKLRLSDFTTFTRSMTLPVPVEDVEAIHQIAWRLMEREVQPGRRFRLVGVEVSNFGMPDQLALFDSSRE